MKIQSVNSIKFGGVFTDKSYQNNGNWRMEYSPYSWENDNSSRMKHKEKIDIFASTLPDNEEIYKVKSESYYRIFESSEDLLGTVSYWHDFKKDDMRKTIVQVPSMDRETSLDVLRKKLEKFMAMKGEYGNKILNDMKENMSKVNESKSFYNKASVDYDAGFLASQYSKSTNKSIMDENASKIVDEAQKMYNSSKDYVKLRASMDDLRINIEKTKQEVEKLKDARLNHKLIDISKRDVYDPNKLLWDALQDIRNCYGKLVALPHKTVTVEELISESGVKLTDTKLASKIIKFVDELIAKRI